VRQTAAVPVVRPTSDSFVVVDLEGADRCDGVVRWAKKILLDGARSLARSRTYAWASIGEQISGASVGISAPPEDRDEAIAAFDRAPCEFALGLDIGKGVNPGDLPVRTAADWRNPLLNDDDGAARLALVSAGAVAAAAAQLGGLHDSTVAVEGPPPAINALGTAFAGSGAEVLELDEHSLSAVIAARPDVLVLGSAVGLLDHVGAATIEPAVIVPWGPMPVTTRAVAVARRNGVEVLPDFVTTVGPLIAAVDSSTDLVGLIDVAGQRIGGIIEEVRDHPEGPLVGAAIRAEEFLSTWQAQLPFGRPIA